MIKKKIGMLVVAGVVVLAGVTYAVGAYKSLSECNDKLTQALAEYEVKIASTEDLVKTLEEENLNMKMKLWELSFQSYKNNMKNLMENIKRR